VKTDQIGTSEIPLPLQGQTQTAAGAAPMLRK
jgi:hypothetical protein